MVDFDCFNFNQEPTGYLGIEIALAEMSIPRKNNIFLLIIIIFGLVIKVTLVQVSSALMTHIFSIDCFLHYLFIFPQQFNKKTCKYIEKFKEFVVNTSKDTT